MSLAYYNEHDLKAASWLRELIKAGHIAPGIVDTRSIEDVTADDIDGFTQCHFFAGIGGWSRALRLAGWPDDRRIWTGSCPCQPFSQAGKGAGFTDERHLWPSFFHLIGELKPAIVFGEQVASKDGLEWLDTVSSDLEGAGYAVGSADLCAAGVGAPHIRQRLYWVAHAEGQLRDWRGSPGRTAARDRPADGSVAGGLANTDGGHPGAEREQRGGQHGQQPQDGSTVGAVADAMRAGRTERGTITGDGSSAGSGSARIVAHPGSGGREVEIFHAGGGGETSGLGQADVAGGVGASVNMANADLTGREGRGGAVGGGERTLGQTRARSPVGYRGWPADFIYCRDGKWRPVEPGTFPLAHGVPGRMGLLRGYGNAIVPEVAQAFIESYLEAT